MIQKLKVPAHLPGKRTTLSALLASSDKIVFDGSSASENPFNQVGYDEDRIEAIKNLYDSKLFFTELLQNKSIVTIPEVVGETQIFSNRIGQKLEGFRSNNHDLNPEVRAQIQEQIEMLYLQSKKYVKEARKKRKVFLTPDYEKFVEMIKLVDEVVPFEDDPINHVAGYRRTDKKPSLTDMKLVAAVYSLCFNCARPLRISLLGNDRHFIRLLGITSREFVSTRYFPDNKRFMNKYCASDVFYTSIVEDERSEVMQCRVSDLSEFEKHNPVPSEARQDLTERLTAYWKSFANN